MLARFLFAIPQSFIGTRRIAPCPVPDAVKECFCNNLLELLRLRVSSRRDSSTPTIEMSSAAERRLRDLEVQLEPRMGPDGDLAWAPMETSLDSSIG